MFTFCPWGLCLCLVLHLPSAARAYGFCARGSSPFPWQLPSFNLIIVSLDAFSNALPVSPPDLASPHQSLLLQVGYPEAPHPPWLPSRYRVPHKLPLACLFSPGPQFSMMSPASVTLKNPCSLLKNMCFLAPPPCLLPLGLCSSVPSSLAGVVQ